MNPVALTWRDLTEPRDAAPTAGYPGLSVRVDTLTPGEWDRLASSFDDWHLFQTAAFADGLRGERRMSHLALARDGVVVAGARVAIIKPAGFPSGIAYIKHGPFWRRAGQRADQSIYRAAIAALVQEYGVRRGHMVSISPRPHPDFSATEEALLAQAGFAARPRRSGPISFFLVNTGIGERALRASLSQAWRSHLKRAEANGLDIRFHDAREALGSFCDLHKAMLARNQFTDRDPARVLAPILEQLPAASSHIVIAAHRGEPVAGAVLIVTGDMAYYLYGASADSALPLHAGYALHWRIACWLGERDVHWYDLGDAYGGLRQFKQGFVGKSGSIIERAGELDFSAGARARLSGEVIYGARNLALAVRSARRWAARKTRALAGRTQ